MKISIFISALSGGGAERVTCNLANHLAKTGHEVEILTMGDTPAADPLEKGVAYLPLLPAAERKNIFVGNIKRIYRLLRYMKKSKTDAYVVMLPIPTTLMLSFSRLTKSPIIVSERIDPHAYSPRVQKRLSSIAHKASAYIFQTAEAQSWYRPHIGSIPNRVIPNAINPAFIREPYQGEREKIIVAAGRLTEQKNFPLLIRAFASICEKYPEHRLVIYGRGESLEALKQLAAALGVLRRVDFPGFVSNMPDRLERAEMFVLSSDYEGMPNSLMEAMALGLPCISTDCGGGSARFLIKDGENGRLVPVGDVAALSLAMERVLSDKVFAEKLGAESRKLQQTLAPEKIYGQWEKLITDRVSKTTTVVNQG